MGDNFTSININNFITEPNPNYGVNKLQDIISSFSCTPNEDVEKFLHKNAKSSFLSNNARKVIERVSKYDSQLKEYCASAYLVAQLGKNFNLPMEKRISGSKLLEHAIASIRQAQNLVGGTIVFLECESHPKLMSFYEQNLFREFSSRITDNSNNEGLVLNQMFRLI